MLILVGGPKTVADAHHDNANDNYLKPAVRHAKLAVAAGQKPTIIIYGPAYDVRDAKDVATGKRKSEDPANLQQYVEAAKKAGANVKIVKSAKDMMAEASASGAREGVDGIKYFGHSGPQKMLLNYEQEGRTGDESFTSDHLVKAVPPEKLKKDAQARFYGCHTGETQAQTRAWGERFKGSSIAEDLSNAYRGHTVVGSSDKSLFQSVGQGFNSPTSKGGYQYWKDGKMIKQDPAGKRPSDEKR